jgi:hypothetical protein
MWIPQHAALKSAGSRGLVRSPACVRHAGNQPTAAAARAIDCHPLPVHVLRVCIPCLPNGLGRGWTATFALHGRAERSLRPSSFAELNIHVKSALVGGLAANTRTPTNCLANLVKFARNIASSAGIGTHCELLTFTLFDNELNCLPVHDINDLLRLYN